MASLLLQGCLRPQPLTSLPAARCRHRPGQASLRCAAQHLVYSSITGALMGEDGRYDAFETLLEVRAGGAYLAASLIACVRACVYCLQPVPNAPSGPTHIAPCGVHPAACSCACRS